ncbi:pentatricopeptide repeat-containing protein [Prunus yedoensis var. nudiflora]|uniref:Pentatricopeptide repeat-containing protein n=1 Tax=Prunus yedoensis var. nudiflora TaxID=2094558 RepID=A0A314XKU0_PRUYE|nr:pentatricopeptide repeat-containing protein [Prunus yedoensis var. nudiflora]
MERRELYLIKFSVRSCLLECNDNRLHTKWQRRGSIEVTFTEAQVGLRPDKWTLVRFLLPVPLLHYLKRGQAHMGCLAFSQSRAGQLEKACKIIEEMPFDADCRIWGSLLASAVFM